MIGMPGSVPGAARTSNTYRDAPMVDRIAVRRAARAGR